MTAFIGNFLISSYKSPLQLLEAPSYNLIDEKKSLGLSIHVEVEQLTSIDYKYWLDDLYRSVGPSFPHKIKINVNKTQLFISLFKRNTLDTDTPIYKTWEIPFRGQQIVFTTAVDPSPFWTVTFLWKAYDYDNNSYTFKSSVDFVEGQQIVNTTTTRFPDAYISFVELPEDKVAFVLQNSFKVGPQGLNST